MCTFWAFEKDGRIGIARAIEGDMEMFEVMLTDVYMVPEEGRFGPFEAESDMEAMRVAMMWFEEGNNTQVV